MTEQTPRVAIVLRYGLNPVSWGARHARGDVIDVTPYAYDLASEWFTLEWTTDAPEGRLRRTVRGALRRLLGFDIVHIWHNRRMIERADAVWTHTEREHLAVAMLSMLRSRSFRAVSIAQSVWLWDVWRDAGPLRRALYRRLLRQHDVELVLSRLNRDAALAELPDRTVLRIPFGTHFAQGATTSATAHGSSAGPSAPAARVFVVGNDRHRDWDLLHEVTTLLPHVEFDLLSLSADVRGRPWPRNVTIGSADQQQMLDTAYAKAAVVALPLRPNLHASGCTVAIEAISASTPLVVSDAGGIDEYVHGADASLVPVGDVRAFADALSARIEASSQAMPPDPAIAERRGLTQQDYVRRLASITFSVLQKRDIDDAVQAFSAMPNPAEAPRRVSNARTTIDQEPTA